MSPSTTMLRLRETSDCEGRAPQGDMRERGRGRSRPGGSTTTGQPLKAAPNALPGEKANGWILLAHPLFLEQLERLTARASEEVSNGGRERPATKLLAHVLDLMLEKIPQNPGGPAYRHGGALGGGSREWFPAKTGNGRFRLFYRFSTKAEVIIYAWLNDEQSLRTYGSTTDAYSVFTRMLEVGNPPTGWAALYAEASKRENADRLRQATQRRAKQQRRDR